MKTLLLATVLAIGWLMFTTVFSLAGTSCTTRKSGSTVITSCSSSGHGNTSSTCRSYKSGSVVKTSCS